jgi:transposase-like protein
LRTKKGKVMVKRIERKTKHDRAGAPTKYDPNIMPTAARFLAQHGAIMSEIADAFQISRRTIHYWMNQHQEFHDAVQVGVDAFNARVERALAERAIGFSVTIKEEVRDEQGKVIQQEQRRYYPPDPTSMIFFLKNRMRDKYKDVHKIDSEVRLLKTSEELRIEIRKDILELQAQGYDPKIIDDDDDAPALPAPKRGNGSGNGAG